VYEVIAKRIIDATGIGERDPVRLRNVGLAALGRQGDGKQASWAASADPRLSRILIRQRTLPLPTVTTPVIPVAPETPSAGLLGVSKSAHI
jgi:hypothetical protein